MLVERRCRRCGGVWPLDEGLLRRAGYDFRSPVGVTYECSDQILCDAARKMEVTRGG